MRIGIMQPYFFPYMGYFQLIDACDLFIVLDDAAFIKKGWIHRNRLCFNGTVHWFSVPLQKVSQYRTINGTYVSEPEFLRWKRKFLASLSAFYKRQPHFADGMDLVQYVLSFPAASMADIALASLRACCGALSISTPMRRSSTANGPSALRREARLIELCRQHHGDRYLNPPGGQDLYTSGMFAPHGIRLEFLHPRLTPYPVKGRDCLPGLSVLDALMCCGRDYVREKLLCGYDIVEAA